jgi:hypothetical protein
VKKSRDGQVFVAPVLQDGRQQCQQVRDIEGRSPLANLARPIKGNINRERVKIYHTLVAMVRSDGD